MGHDLPEALWPEVIAASSPTPNGLTERVPDPDGHPSEVANNPGRRLAEDGLIHIHG